MAGGSNPRPSRDEEEVRARRDVIMAKVQDDLPEPGRILGKLPSKIRLGKYLQWLWVAWNVEGTNGAKPDFFPCLVEGCNLGFDRIGNAVNHIRTKHEDWILMKYVGGVNLQGDGLARREFCREEGCTYTCGREDEIKRHMDKKHDLEWVKDDYLPDENSEDEWLV